MRHADQQPPRQKGARSPGRNMHSRLRECPREWPHKLLVLHRKRGEHDVLHGARQLAHQRYALPVRGRRPPASRTACSTGKAAIYLYLSIYKAGVRAYERPRRARAGCNCETCRDNTGVQQSYPAHPCFTMLVGSEGWPAACCNKPLDTATRLRGRSSAARLVGAMGAWIQMPPLASLMAVMRTLVDVLLARLCSCSKIHSVPRSTSVRIVSRTSRGPSGKGNLPRAQRTQCALQPGLRSSCGSRRRQYEVQSACPLPGHTARACQAQSVLCRGPQRGLGPTRQCALVAVGPQRGLGGERGPARAR